MLVLKKRYDAANSLIKYQNVLINIKNQLDMIKTQVETLKAEIDADSDFDLDDQTEIAALNTVVNDTRYTDFISFITSDVSSS